MQDTVEATQLLFWLGVTVAAGAGSAALGLWRKPLKLPRRPRASPLRTQAACGTILAIRRKAHRGENELELELLLRVEPNDRGPFLACPTLRVSALQLPHVQPSRLVTVRYHPGLERQATIESLGYIETDPRALRRALKADVAQAVHLNATGEEASAIITGFTTSGVFRGSDNQAATLELKVLAPNRPLFSATARGVFDAAFLQRFQPGNRILVRFDPKRPHLVAIDLAWAHGKSRPGRRRQSRAR